MAIAQRGKAMGNTSAVDLMKADLPDMPIDAIEMWLVTFHGRFGWPPKVDNEWRYILGLGNDLAWLQNFKWSKESLRLTPEMLTPTSRDIVVGLFRTYVLNHTTAFSTMSDGPQRFRSVCDYMKQHHRFPRPIILNKTSDGYSVLDGNHRLTAFFYLYGFFAVENDETPNLDVHESQEAWVAAD